MSSPRSSHSLHSSSKVPIMCAADDTELWPIGKRRDTTDVPLPLLRAVARRRGYYFDIHT